MGGSDERVRVGAPVDDVLSCGDSDLGDRVDAAEHDAVDPRETDVQACAEPGGAAVKPRYSKRTVDEAVQLLDVYASQLATHHRHMDISAVQDEVGTSDPAFELACDTWLDSSLYSQGADLDTRLRLAAAEAAQRLREGWRP
jgi:hypothetical protein